MEKLLNKFVTLESVDDVVCDKCQRSASFVKKLTIGKVQHSVCLSVCLSGWLSLLLLLFYQGSLQFGPGVPEGS